MELNLDYHVSPKEQINLFFRIVLSAAVYISAIIAFVFFNAESEGALTGSLVTLIPLTITILFIYVIRNGLLIGFIKANSVQINENQLPEIYKIVLTQSKALGIKRTPKVYLLQAGGSLNALAARFFNQGYVIIFSDLLEAYYEGNKDAIEFVVGHELGHLKRNHFLKELLLFPSNIIPFITFAYYRGCEYTCDNIGAAFNQRGAVTGITILASGKALSKSINILEFVNQQKNDKGFWRWLAEKFQTHPAIYKRVEPFYSPEIMIQKSKPSAPAYKRNPDDMQQFIKQPDIQSNENTEQNDDASRFMPKA